MKLFKIYKDNIFRLLSIICGLLLFAGCGSGKNDSKDTADIIESDNSMSESEINDAQQDVIELSGDMFVFDKNSKYDIDNSEPSSMPDNSSTLGSLTIKGLIVKEYSKDGIPAFEISDDNLFSLKYTCNEDLRHKEATEWHLIDDNSKTVNGIDLEDKIEYGAVILQSSLDRKKWITINSATNVYSDYSFNDAENKNVINDIQLTNGCYYRIIVAYEIARELDESKIPVIDLSKKDKHKISEVYEFYASYKEHDTDMNCKKFYYNVGFENGNKLTQRKKKNDYDVRASIDADDVHYGWNLGSFCLSGYTDTGDSSDTYLKTVGDKIELSFRCNEDIDCLRGNDQLIIGKDKNGYDKGLSQAPHERASAVYSVIGEVEGKNLDRQQLVAISKEVHTHLVLAGAGTGKTTTIVGLVKYLIGINKYSPDEILVLSFTNASASEMKERLDKETGVSIEASTFHKLGMNIISEVNGIKPKISQLDQRQFIKQHLESLMQNNDYLRVLNAYLMRRQFMIRSEFDFKTLQEYQEHLKKNPPVTLKHEAVKSYGEMEIANFLYLNGVEYIYEQPYKIDTRTKEFGQYKPDFYLPKYEIYIEYFGIDKNGNPPAYFQNDYVASMKWKRELHKANNTTMIESYAYENFEGILTSALEKKLLEKDVAIAPLSQEEIWKKISEDDANVIDGLVQLIETVINLMKNNRYDIAEMRRRNVSSFNLDDVSYLLDVISPIWNRYIEYLKDNDKIDFNDMINIASDYVRDGRYKSKYKMVMGA